MLLPPNARVLVVAAHADDEAIGCGGLLMKHTGPKAVIVATGMRSDEFRTVAVLANFKHVQYDYADQQLDMLSQINCNRNLEQFIKVFNPDVVLTHSIHDNNLDHQFVHKSVNVAARFVDNLVYFRIPSPGEFPGFDGRVSYKINWEDKKKLLQVYDGEMRSWPHPRSYKNLETDTEYFEIGRLAL